MSRLNNVLDAIKKDFRLTWILTKKAFKFILGYENLGIVICLMLFLLRLEQNCVNERYAENNILF